MGPEFDQDCPARLPDLSSSAISGAGAGEQARQRSRRTWARLTVRTRLSLS
jgi:hypothetical protein